VAARALVDAWRADSARRRRETAAALDPAGHPRPAGPDGIPDAGRAGAGRDDTLVLLFLCCHPALSPPSQLALTLRAAGGLTTAQIAAAFLVPETTIAKRIARAKQRIRDAGARFELPAQPQRTGRLGVVLHVLYLIFNEGYTTSSGPALQRTDLTAEAIRLTRLLHGLLPGETEAAGLLALMLLIQSRRAARTDGAGELVRLADQDRARWDHALIAEGQAIVRRCLARRQPGPYQIQAAINAVHGDAATAAQTDWGQILALYDQLMAVAPTPVVALNRAVAVAEVQGPAAALAEVQQLDLDGYHLYHAIRADLLARTGDDEGAAAAYDAAISLTENDAERESLRRRRRSASGRALWP
jgi:RNA polymerase sigma-70 factor (ECF subfamily)